MKKTTPSNWKETLLNSIDQLLENKNDYFEKPEIGLFSKKDGATVRH